MSSGQTVNPGEATVIDGTTISLKTVTAQVTVGTGEVNIPAASPSSDCSFLRTFNLPDYKCEWIHWCGCPPIQANPDIAGTGVRLQ